MAQPPTTPDNRHLIRKLLLLVMSLGVVSLGVAAYLHQSGVLMPGPVSAMQRYNQPLGGFASHAEFEQQCAHCHAPVHCVTATRCQDCHMDVARQRVDGAGLHGRLPSGRCQDCHKEHQGREVAITEFAFANVNHEQLAGFSLAHHQTDYAGELLTCESCHSQNRYVSDTLDCLTCHVQADHDYMASHLEQYPSACTDCHDGRDRMANFDHRQSYPLKGLHVVVPCNDCHANQTYPATPRDCVACHPEPEVHQAQFGTDCARCHTEFGWQSAQLTRHNFPLNHGATANLSCEICHLDTYQRYTCYQCHDHTPAQMETVHVGLKDFTTKDCAECHPAGQPDQPDFYGPGVALK